MAVKGLGLKSNGLHKAYGNGSPHDSRGATEKTRTGGGVTAPGRRADGLHSQYTNASPAEIKNPVGAGTPKVINATKDNC